MEFLLKKLSDKIFAQCYLLMLVVLRGAPPVFVNLLVLVNNRHGESLKKKGIIPSFCDTEGTLVKYFCQFLFLVGPVRAENVLFLLKENYI